MSDDAQPLDRLTFLKQAFGDQANAFEDNLNEVAKINFEACKLKLLGWLGLFRRDPEVDTKQEHAPEESHGLVTTLVQSWRRS